jgi:hypothetical protein
VSSLLRLIEVALKAKTTITMQQGSRLREILGY